MGGKAKRERTKNNARPSSSGRSAELLISSTKDPAIFGLITGKPLPPLFPTLTAVNFEQGLNKEYVLCFKRFNKKDPITKTKALQELLEITKNDNTDNVVAALPAWAHFYPILTVDADRKVRECTQACHASIVQLSGRQLAPQLKRLLPAWLLAQHDEHGPAYHHAHSSLKNTFPERKLAEAISFCKVEISSLLLANLTGNAEGMLVKKIEDEDGKKMQISHIIASSLGALALFVRQLLPSSDEWLWSTVLPLLRGGAFWKLIQNASDQVHVRAAWYGAVGRLMERFGQQVGAECGARAVRALLAVPERAPAAAHRWAALLLLMHNVKDWHSWVDNKDLLVKRLLDLLEHGGWGDAKVLSDLLLPLLAHLPPDLLSKHFYLTFFNSLFVGLEKKNILSSKSERQAWIKNIADCLRYLSVQQSEFAAETVSCVHRAWLAKVLAVQENQARINLIKYTMTHIASLLKFWLKRSKEESGDKYDQLLRNCWQNVGSTISTQIDSLSAAGDGISRVMDDHVLLLRSLRTAFNQDEKRRHSIKFAGDAQIEPEAEVVPKTECDATDALRYAHNLREVVHTTCSLYLELAARPRAARAVLPALVTVLMEFDECDLYAALARHLGAGSVYGLYEKVLRSWLADDTMRCKALVDIVFLLLKYLSEEEQDRVFDSFAQLDESTTEWCLALCLSHPHCTAPATARWLRGAGVQRALLPLCARALSLDDRASDSAAAHLLLQCAAYSTHGESVTSADTIEVLVCQVCAALTEGAVKSDGGTLAQAGAPAVELTVLERRARIAAQLSGALAAAHSVHCASLARALFALQLRVPRGDPRLPPDTWQEVCSSWQDAVFSLPVETRSAFLADIVSLVHQMLFENLERLDVTKIENIVNLLSYVVAPSEYAAAPGDCAELVDFTRRLFALSGPAYSDTLEFYALKSDCIMGNLNCPFGDNDLLKKIIKQSSDAQAADLHRNDVMISAYKWLFKAFYLRTILLRRSDGDGAEESVQEPWCNAILQDIYFREELLALLHHYTVISTLNDRFAFWANYDVIKQTKRHLDDILDEIMMETSVEMRQRVLAALSERSASVGYYWSYARRFYELAIQAKGDESTAEHGAGQVQGIPVSTSERQEDKQASEQARGESEADVNNLTEIVNGWGFCVKQANLEQCEDENERVRCKFLVVLRSVYAAHELIPCDFVTDTLASLPDCNLDVLINLHFQYNEILLSEREVLSAPWVEVVSNAAVLDLLTEVTSARGWDQPAHHWDFTLLTLVCLIESLRLSMDNWSCTKMAVLFRSALRLFARVQQFAASVRRRSEQRRPHLHVLAVAREWADVFAPTINTALFSIILTIFKSTPPVFTVEHINVVGALAEGAPHLQWELLPAEVRSGDLALQYVVSAAAGVMRDSTHTSVKLLAFKVLNVLAEPLVLADASLLAQWSEQEGNPRPALSLALYHDTLAGLQDLVDAALSNVSESESCELVAGTDSHRAACAYLLLHVALYEQCSLARGDLVHHYIHHFREHRYAESLLATSLPLLPAPLLPYAYDESGTCPLPALPRDHFAATPDFTVEDICLASSISSLACRAMLAALGGPGGADARGWWGALGARQARALRRLVTAYVSPPLQRAQLADLMRRAGTLPDTEVSVLLSGEARCCMQLEGRTLELCVEFPDAYPLVPPRVSTCSQPAAPDTHWLTVYLAYQNGSLYNTFKMWIRAVTARIENSPQCYICYCRLHPTSGRLPSVFCRQCRNKFHSACLRKWFTSSNKSNCPLCRTSF